MLSTPGFLPPKTYVPAIGHSITMILINVALVIKQVSDDPVLDEQIDRSIDLLQRCFMHPEFETLLETVSPDGRVHRHLRRKNDQSGTLHGDGLVPARRAACGLGCAAGQDGRHDHRLGLEVGLGRALRRNDQLPRLPEVPAPGLFAGR